MATKVKPSRLKVSGTPQVGQVPVYVDEDTFQWGAGGGGGNVKSFTLSSTSDLTTAQEAYDWYNDGNVAIIVYNDKEYLFDYATAGNAYWSVANEEAFDTASNTGMRRASLQLALSSGTVTAVTTLNISVNDLKVLRTDKDYGTPYTPQYNGSPATKKYVDDSVSTLMGLGKFLSLWDATTGQPISFPLSTPYTYNTGDYYLVETISSATPPVNYKPTGSSYTGTASSTTESEELEVGDIYIYDGTNWLLQLNHGKTVSFSEIAGDPYDNTDLSDALTAKQDELVSSVNIRTINGTSILGSGDISTPTGPNYTAGDGIEIYTGNDYTAMRGPCAMGWHIPLQSEMSALRQAGVTMGAWTTSSGDNMKTYLKMPYAGYRSYSDATVVGSGTVGYYWTSSVHSSLSGYASILNIQTSTISFSGVPKAAGASIRPFKDVPVIPDASWTTLFDGSGTAAGAGIFYSSALQLISISSDGDNWITIADRNQGANVVYNSGDTLSGNNCGYRYQRGNGAAFGWYSSGSITGTTTQVDASGYGPDKPFSYGTFVKGRPDWSSVQNDNLWGGVTGIQLADNRIQEGPESMKVFQVRNTRDLSGAQALVDYVVKTGKPACMTYGIGRFPTIFYPMSYPSKTSTTMKFAYAYGNGATSSGPWLYVTTYTFNLSNYTVTSITYTTNQITISSSAPSSSTANNIITLVI